MSQLLRVCGKVPETGDVMTLTFKDGVIAAAQRGEPPKDDSSWIGGPDVWLAPGFLDLQLNGYAGHDFGAGEIESAEEAAAYYLPVFERAAVAGTPLLCPTITTNSHEMIAGSLRSLVRAMEYEPRLARAMPGIHVEGPYLSPEDGPRGAHPLEHVRAPDWEEFQRFQEAAGGRIRLFTLAPEWPGALAFIEKVAQTGVVVCVGHTAAAPETIRDAAAAGARMSTHLGNGAHAQIARHPNYIWEQLANDYLFAGAIADGHHLPRAVLKVFARVKGPEKLALVSDAVSLGGLAPGIYSDGRHEVLPSGKVVLAGTPYLAGAGHLMDTCVANALRWTDFSVAQAVRSASTTPARILGLETRKGSLRVGADADLTLFRVPPEGPLEIVATVLHGEAV